MLHLFNSCYVYPDITFNPSDDYVVVGENHLSYGAGVNSSFYYNNVQVKECLGRFKTYEEFKASGLLHKVVMGENKVNIFADDEELIKFYAAYYKTQVKKITKQFFLDACKIEAVRLKTRAKIIDSDAIQTKLNGIANQLNALKEIPSVEDFGLDDKWVMINAGVEWKLMLGKPGNAEDLVNRFVYSHFDEARVKFLSRKDPAGWVIDEDNFSYETVKSMKDLYLEMRKEVTLYTDPLIMKFYDEGLESIISDPQFLLLISANKNMPDKINIWLLRWVMKMTSTQIKNLGVLA